MRAGLEREHSPSVVASTSIVGLTVFARLLRCTQSPTRRVRPTACGHAQPPLASSAWPAARRLFDVRLEQVMVDAISAHARSPLTCCSTFLFQSLTSPRQALLPTTSTNDTVRVVLAAALASTRATGRCQTSASRDGRISMIRCGKSLQPCESRRSRTGHLFALASDTPWVISATCAPWSMPS